ncbi:MAG: hypothetical protein ACREFY_19220 [Acetobacteraceae bacterium]
MSLDLTFLDRSMVRLAEALDIYARDPSQTLIRDGPAPRVRRFGAAVRIYLRGDAQDAEAGAADDIRIAGAV